MFRRCAHDEVNALMGITVGGYNIFALSTYNSQSLNVDEHDNQIHCLALKLLAHQNKTIFLVH